MANVFDNAVKGYTIGLNNKLNAQKAYINSYLDGINARNAVNQEGRTQDQYYNYTQPLQASNLGIIVGQNNIQQRILNDPNYQNDLFGVATSKASQANQLATADLNNIGYYIDTQGNLAKTGTATSEYNLKDAKFNLSQQGEVNKQKAIDIAHSGKMQPIQNKTALKEAQQYYDNITETAPIDGVPTNKLGVDDGSAGWAFAKGLEVQKNGGSSLEAQAFMIEGNRRKANAGKTPLPQPVAKQNEQQQVNPFSGLTMAQLQQKALELTGDPTAQSVKTHIGTNVRQYVPNFLLSADTIGADAGRIQAIDSLRQAIGAEQNRLRIAEEKDRAAMIEKARQSSYNKSIGAK